MNKTVVLLLLIVVVSAQAKGQTTAFVNHTEFGPLIGKINGNETRINFSIQTFSGVKLNPYHELGFLVGLDSYPGFRLMPLALGWRGVNDKGKKYSPYASLDIGYGSAWLEKRITDGSRESWYQGGFLFNPAIGIRKKAKHGPHSFSWSIGFKRQNAFFYEGNKIQGTGSMIGDNQGLPPGFSSIREEKYTFNSLFLKWGIVF